jgi:transcriptional regulator with XRE-family HTH domain
MPKQNVTNEAAPAAVVQTVQTLGESIAIARQRRNLRQSDLAAKAGVTPKTLQRVEAGELGTGIGVYSAVLWALGLHGDLAAVASPDSDLEGRTLEAARRGQRVRPKIELSDDF